MDERTKYISIKDAVVYGFDEYINEEHFSVCQASGKIIEEDWREVNFNVFTKASYFLNIAIESFKKGQIADFIYEKLDDIIWNEFDEVIEEELISYKEDLNIFEQMKREKYEILITSIADKSRIEYLLNLKNKK